MHDSQAVMLLINGGLTCIINLRHDVKFGGPHAFLYVMCIGIISRYNEHGRVHYNIYVCHDIIRTFFPPWLWQHECAAS